MDSEKFLVALMQSFRENFVALFRFLIFRRYRILEKKVEFLELFFRQVQFEVQSSDLADVSAYLSSGRSLRVGFCHRLICCCCCRDSFMQKKQVHRQLLCDLTKNHFPKFDGFRFSKPSWQHLFNLELQRQQQCLNHNLELLQ